MSKPRTNAGSIKRSFRNAQLLAMIGSIAAFSAADANGVYFLFSIIGILFTWALSVRPGRPAPRMVINTILLLVILIAGVEMLRVGVGVSAFAVFVVLLLVVKLLDLRSPRDEGQVIVLTVSIVIAAVLTSNSFLTGFLTAIECLLLLRAVILYQIYSVAVLSGKRDGRFRRRARIDIRSMMIATGFLCALIGSVVFIVLPRNIGSQAFGQWGGRGSVSGFADEVELGRPGLITMSSTPVLDLTVTDRDGKNIGSENAPPIYLRGAVLEEYDSGRWKRSSMMRVPLAERIRLFPGGSVLKPRDGEDRSRWDQQYEIALRATNDGPVFLFAPWRTVEFRIGQQPMRMGFDFQRGLFLKDGIGGATTYIIRSVNDEFREIRYPSGQERSFVDRSEIDPQIAQLAAQIVAAGGVDPDPGSRPIEKDASAVRLIETYLRTNYTYSLDAQPVPRDEDATRWFLFEQRTGHCEYYASSLTLMARAIGVPARVVTGYIGSDYNSVTGQYLVRESNAHAWTEAEVSPGQWRTFDGTPPSDFHSIHVPDPGLMHSLSKMYESLEFLWVRTVVGYDSDTRSKVMGSGVGDFGLARMGDQLLARFAAGRSRLVTRAVIVAMLVFASTMFLGILAVRYQSILGSMRIWWSALLHRWLSRRTKAPSSDQERQLSKLESTIHDGLRQSGFPKPKWTPLIRHLNQHRSELSAAGLDREALDEAAEVIYVQRFSNDADPIDSQSVVLMLKKLRKSEKSGPRRVDQATDDGLA